jgi:membrane associated rhomboid family serine protease
LSEDNPLEAQTDLTTYLDQGKQALAQGKGREAAIAYAHGAQLEPENPLVHLGLAEANLALGSNGVVLMACRKTQELAPEGPIYHLAQALLDLLDQHYESALQQTDSAIKDDPGNGYAHALRAYLLRATNQTYDAGLARARASRLSFGGTFEHCFPAIEPVYTNGYQNQPTSFTPPQETPSPEAAARSETPSYPQQYEQQQRQQREQIPPWSRTSRQRQMIRTRFWMSRNPRFLTYLIIAINALGFLLTLLFNSMPGLYLALQNDFGRLVLSTFIPGDILQLAFSAFSLFFVGSTVEMLFGKWRYLAIYLIAGIVGNFLFYTLTPGFAVPALGANAAIFGAFGALGAFFIANRRALGPAANAMLGQWVFWLVLNLAFAFYGGLGLPSLIGGLLTGIVLGIILIPRLRRTGRRVI